MSTVIDDEQLEGKEEPQGDEEQKPPQKGVLIDEHGEPIPPVETERQARKRPLYRRPAFLIAAVIVILVSALLGTRYWLYARSHESTDDAFIDAHITQVSPKVSGYVLKLHVDSNQQVNKGDLLAEIDPRDFQAKLDQAQAALAAGEARLKEARSGVALTRANTKANVQQATASVQQARAGVAASEAQAAAERSRVSQAGATIDSARANLQQTRAQLSAAEAELVRAKADVTRYQQLFGKDEVSRQQLDQAIAAARTADAQVRAAQQRVNAAAAQVDEMQASQSAASENARKAQ